MMSLSIFRKTSRHTVFFLFIGVKYLKLYFGKIYSVPYDRTGKSSYTRQITTSDKTEKGRTSHI